MDSVSPMIYVLGVIVLALLATLFAVLWRFTTVHASMMGISGRFAERNELQRDRFVAMLHEKENVKSDVGAALRMAQLHSNESRVEMAYNLQRDADAMNQKRTQRLNDRLAKETREQNEMASNPQQGMQ